MSDIDNGRIRESQLVIPALRAMADKPGGYISTADLIGELTNIFQPTGKDAEILAERNDTYFSQKVRNLISHKEVAGNFIAEGYAEYVDGGLRITEAGREHLNQQSG